MQFLLAKHAHLRHRSFAAGYLTLSGGETFSKVCVMAAFAYLARVLAPADYGLVERALGITVFLVLGVESGMGLYGARVVAAAPERVPRLVPQVMLLRALFGVPAFAIALVVAARYRTAGLGILAINGIAILLTPFLTQWVFQGLRQMWWVAAGAAARNFTFVALVLILVRPGSDFRLVAVAEVGGVAVLALVNAFLLYGRLRVRLDTTGLIAGTRRLFNDVWFMGLSDLMWACLWYSPALIVGWVGPGGSEQVAWVGSAVRLVLAVHVFVFLYLFNLLPSLATALSVGTDQWRELMERSIATLRWPACLVALGGTLFAPVLIPAVYGASYRSAVLPFQIAIWMIPIAGLNGHFRFSLVAAGQQWSEFVVAVATAAVSIVAGVSLSHYFGSAGAALALVLGGVSNTVLAVAVASRAIGHVPTARSAGPVLFATAGSLGLGLIITAVAGTWPGTIIACLLFVAMAMREDNDFTRIIRRSIGMRG